MPEADACFLPSFANEYPCSAAMMPAIRNDIQTAESAIAPASPRRAKMPAPTIAPTPMNTACVRVIAPPEGEAVLFLSAIGAPLALRLVGELLDQQSLRDDHALDLVGMDALVGAVDVGLRVFSAEQDELGTR